jgi:hypothetical protein
MDLSEERLHFTRLHFPLKYSGIVLAKGGPAITSINEVPEITRASFTLTDAQSSAAIIDDAFYITQLSPTYSATLRAHIGSDKKYARGVYDIITKVVDKDSNSYLSNNPRFFNGRAYINDVSGGSPKPLAKYLTDMYRLINNETVQFKHYAAKVLASEGGDGDYVFSTASYTLTNRDIGATPAHTAGTPLEASLAVYPLGPSLLNHFALEMLTVDPSSLSNYTGLEFQSAVYTPYDYTLKCLTPEEAYIPLPGRTAPASSQTPAPASSASSLPGSPVDFKDLLDVIVEANRAADLEEYVALVSEAKRLQHKTSNFEIVKVPVNGDHVFPADLWSSGWDKFHS